MGGGEGGGGGPQGAFPLEIFENEYVLGCNLVHFETKRGGC